MEIKILGPGCPKCNQTVDLVKEVLDESGVSAKVEKVTDMLEIAQHGVLATPAVVVDGEVKSFGKVPKKDDILKWLSM